MKPLPLPVRLAAGLAVSALDRARRLPTTLAELPVTVVSHALALSMRVQQQITELAIKGDDALATFRPTEETPDWATFDEEAEPAANNGVRSPFDLAPEQEPAADDGPEGPTAGPAALPSYPELSVPQLRARMRRLSAEELRELVDFERQHNNRPAYLGMLNRRIATVDAQQ